MGLQEKFNWTQVALSAISAGVANYAGSKLQPLGLNDIQFNLLSSLAGGAASAGAQSLINGSSFGDNLIAQLPQIIGNTIGNAFVGSMRETARDSEAAREATASANYGGGGYEVDDFGNVLEETPGISYFAARGTFVGGSPSTQAPRDPWWRGPWNMLKRGYNAVTDILAGPSAPRARTGRAPATYQNYTEQDGEFTLPGVDVLANWWKGFNRTIQQGTQWVQTEWQNFQTAPTMSPTQRTAVVWTVDAVVDVADWGYDTFTGTVKGIWDAAPLMLPKDGRQAYLALDRAGALPGWAPHPAANIVDPLTTLSESAGDLAGRVVRGDPTLANDAAEVGEKVLAWGHERYTGPDASRNIRHDIVTGGAEVLSLLLPAKWLRTADQAADAGRALNHLDEAADLAMAAEGNVGMFSSGKLMGIEPASPELLSAVGSRRSVVIAQPGSDEMRLLDYFGAEANVNTSIDGVRNGSILLRPNPSKAAVLEEFLHGTQARLGIVDRLGPSGMGSAETHVKDFMIRHQRMLGLSEGDVQILRILRDEGL